MCYSNSIRRGAEGEPKGQGSTGMDTVDKVKVIKVRYKGEHIATIDAYEGSINVFRVQTYFTPFDMLEGDDGLWYGDLAGEAQTFTKAQIISVCREDIENEMFPKLSGITYDRPETFSIYEFYCL